MNAEMVDSLVEDLLQAVFDLSGEDCSCEEISEDTGVDELCYVCEVTQRAQKYLDAKEPRTFDPINVGSNVRWHTGENVGIVESMDDLNATVRYVNEGSHDAVVVGRLDLWKLVESAQ